MNGGHQQTIPVLLQVALRTLVLSEPCLRVCNQQFIIKNCSTVVCGLQWSALRSEKEPDTMQLPNLLGALYHPRRPLLAT